MTSLAFAHPFRALSLAARHAPLAVREPLALDEPACCRLLHTLRHELGLRDVLVLSTCQRTEVYYAATHDQSVEIMQALAELTGCPAGPGWPAYFEVLNEAEAAARHLFGVALGLEARVVGDWQVLGQVKQAYQWAVAAGTAGPFLHRLVQAVFATHKRVQAETSFRDGTVSASAAALELVRELTRHLARPRVLVVGVGSIGADVCRHLAAGKRFADVALCNRTRPKAAALAAQSGLHLVDFADLPAALREADVVISAIRCSRTFFTRSLVAEISSLRDKLFVDLSMPRSVAPDVGRLPGVQLYNLDAIQDKTSAAQQRRLAAVPQVRALVAESLAGLRAWSQARQALPVISHLKDSLENLRQRELRRHGQHLGPTEAARLEATTRSLMRQVLRQQVLHLKSACQCPDAGPLVAQLSILFAAGHQVA